MMDMLVLLSARGNIDFGQMPDRPPFGCPPDRWVRVSNMDEASAKCRAFIEKNDLGGGNWYGGEVVSLQGYKVARIAYNGSIIK